MGKVCFWFFFFCSEDKINLIWMLFRLDGHGFLKVNCPTAQQQFKSSVFIVKYLFNSENPFTTNSSLGLLR